MNLHIQICWIYFKIEKCYVLGVQKSLLQQMLEQKKPLLQLNIHISNSFI